MQTAESRSARNIGIFDINLVYWQSNPSSKHPRVHSVLRTSRSCYLGPVKIWQVLAFVALASACLADDTKDQDKKPDISPIHTSIVITASPTQPDVDHRNSEVFDRTLFSRDDQIFHVLDAGINAGQHEGGGKSVEIRRFGFNLDHGGVNGGLKVLVDDVQQNQGTQGHGQGYLGSL